MSWIVAPTLNVLLAQYNDMFPNRDKSHDGSIGDTSHSARKSDHNPGPDGIVQARDYSATKAQGDKLSAAALATLKARGQKGYVIWNWRIANPSVNGGAWRKYTGANGHTKHVHVSVHDQLHSCQPWHLGGDLKVVAGRLNAGLKDRVRCRTRGPFPLPSSHWYGPNDGSANSHSGKQKRDIEGIKQIQRVVGVKDDGDYGSATTKGVLAYQRRRNLGLDGLVGPNTWVDMTRGK